MNSFTKQIILILKNVIYQNFFVLYQVNLRTLCVSIHLEYFFTCFSLKVITFYIYVLDTRGVHVCIHCQSLVKVHFYEFPIVLFFESDVFPLLN